jgi:hypothetical protein
MGDDFVLFGLFVLWFCQADSMAVGVRRGFSYHPGADLIVAAMVPNTTYVAFLERS